MSFCENFILIDSPDGTYVKCFEGVTEDRTSEIVRDEVLYAAAKAICFDDCSDDVVKAIYVNGIEYEYVGWQPGMLYEFCSNGKVVWSRRFPEWDH